MREIVLHFGAEVLKPHGADGLVLADQSVLLSVRKALERVEQPDGPVSHAEMPTEQCHEYPGTAEETATLDEITRQVVAADIVHRLPNIVEAGYMQQGEERRDLVKLPERFVGDFGEFARMRPGSRSNSSPIAKYAEAGFMAPTSGACGQQTINAAPRLAAGNSHAIMGLQNRRSRSMPEVYVHAIEGRTKEQKRALIKDITDAVVKNFGVTADAVLVEIVESSRDNKAKGGVLFSER